MIAQNSGRVLVVDDDPEIVTFLSTLLELEGIESSVATSAAMALEQLDQIHPDLVLLDIACLTATESISAAS